MLLLSMLRIPAPGRKAHNIHYVNFLVKKRRVSEKTESGEIFETLFSDFQTDRAIPKTLVIFDALGTAVFSDVYFTL